MQLSSGVPGASSVIGGRIENNTGSGLHLDGKTIVGHVGFVPGLAGIGRVVEAARLRRIDFRTQAEAVCKTGSSDDQVGISRMKNDGAESNTAKRVPAHRVGNQCPAGSVIRRAQDTQSVVR